MEEREGEGERERERTIHPSKADALVTFTKRMRSTDVLKV